MRSQAQRPNAGAGRAEPLDMHPVRVAERIRSYARDKNCAASAAQIKADAEWNLLAWRFMYGGEGSDPQTKKRLALLEAAAACDELGEHREAAELREWTANCRGGTLGD